MPDVGLEPKTLRSKADWASLAAWKLPEFSPPQITWVIHSIQTAYYVFGKKQKQQKMRGISHIKYYCSSFLRTYCLIFMPVKSIHLLCYVHKFTEITRVNRQDNSNFPLYFLRGKIHWLLFSIQILWNWAFVMQLILLPTCVNYRSFIYDVRSFLQKSYQLLYWQWMCYLCLAILNYRKLSIFFTLTRRWCSSVG